MHTYPNKHETFQKRLLDVFFMLWMDKRLIRNGNCSLTYWKYSCEINNYRAVMTIYQRYTPHPLLYTRGFVCMLKICFLLTMSYVIYVYVLLGFIINLYTT